MIVGMRTRGQAARVAALPVARICLVSRNVMAHQHCRGMSMSDSDFEPTAQVVESVSVLFDLYDGEGGGYAASGILGEQVPSGWVVTAAKFEIEWPTDPDRSRVIRSHFGARRKAFNWGLAQVKADMDAGKLDPGHEPVGWDLASLRWAWNRVKHEVAPWWAENSKEAYSSRFG